MKNKLSKSGHCWCQCQFNLVTRYFHTKSFLQFELLIVQWGSENQTFKYWKRNVLKFWFQILNGWPFKKRSMVSLGRFTNKYFIYLNKPRLKTKKGRPFKIWMPFENWTKVDHSKTWHVRFSDPHCTWAFPLLSFTQPVCVCTKTNVTSNQPEKSKNSEV